MIRSVAYMVPPMAHDVTQTLLAGLIDYAGLFPPSSESMRDTVRHYQEYLKSPQSWIIGRLIIPLERLEELQLESSGLASRSGPWHVSCLWPATVLESAATIANACDRMRDSVAAVNGGHSQEIVIDTIEVPCNDADGIRRLAAHLPPQLRGFVEITMSNSTAACLDELQRSQGLAAKFRTGGVTPQAIPPLNRLSQFLRMVTERRVPFKCTAGLHHPLPADRPLTYEPDAPVGTMHGFWNVALASGLLLAGQMDEPTVHELLRDQDMSSFGVTSDELTWKEYRLTHDDVRRLREQGFVSFGSCSFCEPVADLEQLGWLSGVACRQLQSDA